MKQTIILSGGLGNQMFQYAFYLSMKAKGKECKLDTSLYYVAKMHNGFELKKVFGIPENIQRKSFFVQFIMQCIRRFKPKFLLYHDSQYKFKEEVYIENRPFLMGDWLSYKYFNNIRDIVFSCFSFTNIDARNTEIAFEMSQCNSVSLHIRRGDYLNIPYYLVCDECYYKKAIEQIKGNVENPVFYVFSNEPAWCDSFMKKYHVNFKIISCNQGEDSYLDMYLMTQCKHNIIANSTFSWWGAWLNKNESKIVIAPSVWSYDSKYPEDSDINYESWTLINTKKNG